MVLRGPQNQPRGPARCSPLTRRDPFPQTVPSEPSARDAVFVAARLSFSTHASTSAEAAGPAAVFARRGKEVLCPIASIV
jgi:hypothetical protein